MEPSGPTESTGRGLVDRLAIGALLGVLVVSIGGVALLTVYLNRLGDAVEGLKRVDPLASYAGRPSAVSEDGVDAVNYLLTTTDEAGTLEAVVIVHLSSSRRDLTLVALPSDLVADDGNGRTTLAASFAQDPLRTARAVESLTGARMDHQARLDLDGFSGVVDSLGGIAIDGADLSGQQVVSLLGSAPDPLSRSVRTADLLRAAFARANLGSTITDPNRFDKVMDALTPCLTVDSALTSEEIRGMIVESRVRADRIATWPLGSRPTQAGAEPDEEALAALRAAFAEDAFTTTQTPATARSAASAPSSPSPIASAPSSPSPTTAAPTLTSSPQPTGSPDVRIATTSTSSPR
ncbi:LCP family protein [Propionicimonas sp.]|uniref:LCP family glycopolymer transferase n=1 Tax=Propionicimonas sp. TaxID=1955623 RepID=UPI0039E52150